MTVHPATERVVHEAISVLGFSAITLSVWSKINAPLYTVLLALNIVYVCRKLRRKKP